MPPLKPQPQDEASRWASRLRLAMAVLFLLLAAMSIRVFLYVRETTAGQERQLEEFLVALGGKVAASIPADDVLWVLPLVTDPASGELYTERVDAYSDLPAWASLRKAVVELQSGGIVSRASLLSPAGDTILRGDGQEVLESAIRDSRSQDPSLIAAAAAGSIGATQRDSADETKRVYVPLRIPAKGDVSAKVVGILRLEAGREYFAEAQRVERRSPIFLAAVVIVLAVASYSLVRLMRRASQAERQAALSDRLRALGTLTAGIAHEIRNPLGILTLQVEELRAVARASSDEKAKAEVQELANSLQSELSRLKSLTEQFLEYARPAGNGEARGVDLAVALPPMLRLFAKGLPHTRRFVADDFGDAPLPVSITEARLGQVILNLLRNADEAMAAGPGTITVSVRVEDDVAVITVADDGPGLSREVAAQVFDPFFTTRAEGTGLGLPLCRNIVEAIGGRIDLESSPGEGARFTVRLPIVREGEIRGET